MSSSVLLLPKGVGFVTSDSIVYVGVGIVLVCTVRNKRIAKELCTSRWVEGQALNQFFLVFLSLLANERCTSFVRTLNISWMKPFIPNTDPVDLTSLMF